MYTYYSRTSKKTHVDGRAKYIPFDEQVKSTRRGHSSRDFCGQELGIFAINHRKNRIEAERDRSILCHWKISKKRIRISKFSFNVILHLGFMELGLMVFRYNSFFFFILFRFIRGFSTLIIFLFVHLYSYYPCISAVYPRCVISPQRNLLQSTSQNFCERHKNMHIEAKYV